MHDVFLPKLVVQIGGKVSAGDDDVVKFRLAVKMVNGIEFISRG